MKQYKTRSYRLYEEDIQAFNRLCKVTDSSQASVFNKMILAYEKSLDAEKESVNKQLEQMKNLERLNRKNLEMTETILLSLNGYLMLTGQEDYISLKTFASPIVQGALNEIEANKKEAFVKMHSKQMSEGGY